jgi:hypothetical protein
MVKSSRLTILTASRLSDTIKLTAAKAGWERDNTANKATAVDFWCRGPAARTSSALMTAGGKAFAAIINFFETMRTAPDAK